MGSTHPPRLLDQVSIVCRRRHLSPRTEDSYRYWIRQFIYFHGKRHPNTMGGPEVEAFLNHLASERHLSASSQTQALNALVFLYDSVCTSRWARWPGSSGCNGVTGCRLSSHARK